MRCIYNKIKVNITIKDKNFFALEFTFCNCNDPLTDFVRIN